MSIDWGRGKRRKEAAERLKMFGGNLASLGRCAHIHSLNKQNGIISDAEMKWGDPIAGTPPPDYACSNCFAQHVLKQGDICQLCCLLKETLP